MKLPGDEIDVKKDTKIVIIETIRGLAALAVCLFHFGKTNIEFTGSSVLYQKITSKGWLGVEAFFVLSGFIIPYALIKSGYTIKDFYKFFAKRCLRIEPPYLVSILLVLLLGYLSSLAPGYKGAEFQFNAGQFFSHIAYLPEHLGYTWLLPVYWSLEAEFHYYILIGLILPFLFKNQMSLLVGFAILLTLSYFIPLTVFGYMPLFLFGIAACALRMQKINQIIFWTILIVISSITLAKGYDFSMIMTGFLTSLLISYATFNSPVTEFLGKISFSLYLLHIPIGGRILNLGGRYANTDWKVWGIIILALAATLIASWIFYRLVEYPSQLLSKKVKYR